MFTKRSLLLTNLILFELLIYCSSKPVETNNNVINNNQPIDDDNWFNRLIINLLGYGLILFPAGLIVYLVKNDLCVKSGIYLSFFNSIFIFKFIFLSFFSLQFAKIVLLNYLFMGEMNRLLSSMKVKKNYCP